MHGRAVVLAVAIVVAPLGAQGADLVIWWEEGWYPEEDAAVTELVAAFEEQTGTKIELVRIQGGDPKIRATLERGQPPDFVWGVGGVQDFADQWAYEDRLVDLAQVLGPLRELFDRDLLEYATLRNGSTGEYGLYALPMGRITNHIHVWKDLLEQAGFRLEGIPKEWEAFWSFWCDRVQPAVRKATGREDIYGVGLPMSLGSIDTDLAFDQFLLAHTREWPPPAGWNLVEAPAMRDVLVQVLERYTVIYRNGCTPPDAVDWTGSGNNEAFLEQRVVMTTNLTLSVTNSLRQERPQDYYHHTATIEWPRNTFGEPLVITGGANRAVVFRAGGNTAAAKEFVRFLVEDGWLAHWLDFSRDRMLPPMRRLIDQPFWLDPSDPHRMRSAIQSLTQPHNYGWWGIARDQERRFVLAEPRIYRTAVHRVAAEGWSAEQAADEAIARIKQILSEQQLVSPE
jgi:multiple sugar transport system substrate-binding protein